MPETFTCQHCGKIKPRNPRQKNQKYCSFRACQNARRISTNKAKTRKNKESRKLRQARNKRWRDSYPAHSYQHQYREDHPEYVKRNREQQRIRNKRRQKDNVSMIVKTYALSPQPLQDGAYMGFEIKNGKIVKTYAYTSQMQTHCVIESHLPINPG